MRTTLLVLVLLVATVAVTRAQDARSNATGDAIRKVVADYNQALNGADLQRIVKVFEPDAVWMPPNQPAPTGEQAIRQWFQNYFSQTVANLKFSPVEVETAGRWAFARVAVTGTTTPKAGGSSVQQDNKALFVVHQGTDGAWRIARYIINSNKPLSPPQGRR
jgi:uncharacterized protein (TIGR02246 family)